MLAQLGRCARWLAIPILLAAIGFGLWFATSHVPLPFPTPGGQELVVLTQPDMLTADDDGNDAIAGFERDLVERFAAELGVEVRFVIAQAKDFAQKLHAGRAHFAAAWQTPANGASSSASPSFFTSRDVLVQPEASLPLQEIAALEGRTVHVLADSRQLQTLRELAPQLPGLNIVVEHLTPFELLDSVAEGRIELALVDETLVKLALQVAPAIQTTLTLGTTRPIAWLYPEKVNPELQARANDFLQRIQKDAAFADLKDRHFGHIHRLQREDIARFIALSRSALPDLRPHFLTAQAHTGFDWRLLAALAYQESHWDPLATSYTNVRGIMMLTEETADLLGVSNRLDPRQSILAGARYLAQLRDRIPAEIPEPDRTWMALAAYNIGPGHFNAALQIARRVGKNERSWYEMKRVLPLLAKPQYYERLKSGRARGGEAVILVENVRSFYDILSRHESAHPVFRLPAATGARTVSHSPQAAVSRVMPPR